MSEEKNPVGQPEKVRVKIIETRGDSSLIEWINADGLRSRGYIENDLIYDNHVSWNALIRPLPVGPDPMKLDVYKFTRQLRLRDVWTQADFQKKAKAVIRSLLEAMEVK